jgi:hypothetical protein
MDVKLDPLSIEMSNLGGILDLVGGRRKIKKTYKEVRDLYTSPDIIRVNRSCSTNEGHIPSCDAHIGVWITLEWIFKE